MPMIHGPIRQLLILPVVLIVLLGHQVDTAAAAPPTDPTDRLELVRLAAIPPDADSPPGSIRFQVQVNYSLAATPTGYLALFAFEDNAQRSSQHRSDPIPIKAGQGRATLDIEYVPASQVKMLTLIAGLFTEDERLLGWVATNPMPLADWTARIDFQAAMAARMDGNQTEAIRFLSQAIQESPKTGNLYYWRADSRVRLGQYDEAIDDYSKALELMPEHRASMVGRGVALLWKEQWDLASQDLTAALDAAGPPDEVTAWAHRARGIVNASLGHPAEAIADYEAYLALTPEAADRAEVEGWIAQLRALAAG